MPESHLAQQLNTAHQQFLALYGTGEVRVLSAPARINILGEHIDYVSYLPTASLTFGSQQHAMLMFYRPNANGAVRGASANAVYQPFTLSLRDEANELAAAVSWESYVVARPAPVSHWRNYVRGALQYVQWQHPAAMQLGIDFLIDSTIPACGGSSSSSALTCLAGAALREVNGLTVSGDALARASAQAEWFIGTRGGAMDHLTICLSRAGHAALIQHNAPAIEFVSLPTASYRWVTFFSHEADKGSHVMLEYNARAAAARILIPALLNDLRQRRQGAFRVPLEDETLNALVALLDELPSGITLAEFARHDVAAAAECERLFPALVQAGGQDVLLLNAYARHHLSEVRRVKQAVECLRAATTITDDTMRKLGGLLNQSHESLRDLYQVSTPDVEHLRNILLRDIALYGARVMGGGFGGNVLALVQADAVAVLIERVQREFYAPRGRDAVAEGAVMVSLPGNGLQALKL